MHLPKSTHPYSFTSRSHCVPFPEPGPPRTKITDGLIFCSPGAPPSTAAVFIAALSAAVPDIEAATDGVPCKRVFLWVHPNDAALSTDLASREDDDSKPTASIADDARLVTRPAARGR